MDGSPSYSNLSIAFSSSGMAADIRSARLLRREEDAYIVKPSVLWMYTQERAPSCILPINRLIQRVYISLRRFSIQIK